MGLLRPPFATLTIIFSTGSAAALAACGFVPSIWRWILLAVGVALLLGELSLTLIKNRTTRRFQKRSDDEARDREGELAGFLDWLLVDATDRILSALATNNPVDRTASLAKARSHIVDAAKLICGPSNSGVRATYFVVRGQKRGRRLEATGGHAGDSPHSDRVFRKHDGGPGAACWRIAETGLPELWPDLSKESPPGYERGANNYQTFIQCGVLDDSGEVVGMLTVDAPQANELTKIDGKVVHLLCRYLALEHEVGRQVDENRAT